MEYLCSIITFTSLSLSLLLDRFSLSFIFVFVTLILSFLIVIETGVFDKWMSLTNPSYWLIEGATRRDIICHPTSSWQQNDWLTIETHPSRWMCYVYQDGRPCFLFHHCFILRKILNHNGETWLLDKTSNI